jgi:hypothetical protein
LLLQETGHRPRGRPSSAGSGSSWLVRLPDDLPSPHGLHLTSLQLDPGHISILASALNGNAAAAPRSSSRETVVGSKRSWSQSLAGLSCWPDLEVVVADDHGVDPTVELASHSARTVSVSLPRAAQMNAGAREAIGGAMVRECDYHSDARCARPHPGRSCRGVL